MNNNFELRTHLAKHKIIYLLLLMQLIVYFCINLTSPLPIGGTLYWDYGRHLQPAYLDSPYMTAVIIKLYSSIFGSSVLAYKFLKYLIAIIINGLIYLIGCQVYTRKQALIGSALYLLLSASLYDSMNYHTVVVLLSACLLFCLVHWKNTGSNTSIYIGGIFLGMLLMSEFEAYFYILALSLATFVVPTYRKLWQTSACYLAIILALLFTAPFIIWEVKHHWITFYFLESTHTTGLTLKNFLRAIVENIGTLGLFSLVIPALYFILKKHRELDDHSRFFFYIWLFYSLILACAFSDSRVRHNAFSGANITLALFLGAHFFRKLPKIAAAVVTITTIAYCGYFYVNTYFRTNRSYTNILPQVQALVTNKTVVIANINRKDLSPAWFSLSLKNQPNVYAYIPSNNSLTHIGNPAVYIWQPPLHELLSNKKWDNVLFLSLSKTMPIELSRQLICQQPKHLTTTYKNIHHVFNYFLHGASIRHFAIYAHQCKINTQ